MVSIAVSKKKLLKKIGSKMSEAKIFDSLPQIKALLEKTDGDNLSFEITPDRPDMYSAEGIARAARGFFGLEEGLPELKMQKSGIKVFVDSSSLKKRPFAVGALIENVKLDENGVAELFQFQEKLDLT